MDERIVTDAKEVKSWFERNLNWLIGVGCFVSGAILGHVLR